MESLLSLAPILNILTVLVLIIVLSIFLLLSFKKNATEKKDQFSSDNEIISKTVLEYAHAITERTSRVFSDKAQLQKLLRFIMNCFVRLTKADGGMLLLLDNETNNLNLASYEGVFPPPMPLFTVLDGTETSIEHEGISFPKTIPSCVGFLEQFYTSTSFSLDSVFGSCIKKKDIEYLVNDKNSEQFFLLNSEDFARIVSISADDAKTLQAIEASSYLFIPLKYNDTYIGLVALSRNKISHNDTSDNHIIDDSDLHYRYYEVESNKEIPDTFTEYDLENVNILRRFANTSLNTIYDFEVISEDKYITFQSGIASELQNSLYCSNLPYLPKLAIYTYFDGVKGVCSDYFDVIPARKSRVCFVLADVLGRGMHALLLMASLRSMFRILANTTQSVSSLLTWVNKGIRYDSTIVNFANVALVDYNPTTNIVSFSTAGESPVLYYTAHNAQWKNLLLESEPLGLANNTEYKEVSFELQTGDIIVLCTDGLIETVNSIGNQYTKKRLQEIIEKSAHLSCKEITEKVKCDIVDFEGGVKNSEDRSLIILKGK